MYARGVRGGASKRARGEKVASERDRNRCPSAADMLHMSAASAMTQEIVMPFIRASKGAERPEDNAPCRLSIGFGSRKIAPPGSGGLGWSGKILFSVSVP